jgi:hypothetical protein
MRHRSRAHLDPATPRRLSHGKAAPHAGTSQEGHRRLRPQKAARDGLAYRIDDGRVVWEHEPVKLHADDAFAAEAAASVGTSNRGAEPREAFAWLREQLAGGPVPSNQVIAHAKEHGIAERTRRRAFKEMGRRRTGPLH